jgi:predicted nucleic acid-binding protein
LPKVVSNSSPLIYLAKIGELNLLKQFFKEIIVPEAVYKECVIEGKNREDAKKIKKAEWIKVVKIKNTNLKKALMMVLDEGEAEAITLALEESADLILLDDYEAREVARNYGLGITGTIGVLIRANFEGKIGSLEEELEKLKETGFWLSEDLYTKILRELGES